MSGDDETLKILDVLLCAEIFNQNPNLDVNDLTPEHRIMFGLGSASGIKRPVTVSESTIRRVLQIQDPRGKVAENPVVIYEEFGQTVQDTGTRGCREMVPGPRWHAIYKKEPGAGILF